MEKIASFTIDHLQLLRGVYVSRLDSLPSGDTVTTFDVRMTEPNREPALTPRSLHAMEHLAATYLRNHPQWGKRIIYWGPMGCCTGNYLLVEGKPTPEEIVPLLRETFSFIADFDGEVPGATPRDCGNYTFMDLESARSDARRYLTEVLANPAPENLTYPE